MKPQFPTWELSLNEFFFRFSLKEDRASMMEVPGDYWNVEFFATVPSFLSLKVMLTFSCLLTPGAQETVTPSSPQ